MLARLAGNHALKQDLSAALRAGRLPHSILLTGEPGCGAGFAARCLAADYLYPHGGPHAEAVLRGEDSECLTVRGEGASGQIRVERIREAREKIQHSALSADAAGRVLFIYGAQGAQRVFGQRDAQDHGGAARRRAVFADGVQHGRRAADHPQPLRRLYDRAGGDRRVRGRPCARPCPRWTRARPPTSPFCTKGASARRWTR